MHAQLKVLRPLVAALIATAIAVPAFAQSQGLSPTGPGTAAAARVTTVTATVTNIDLTTRQVTLRRPDGSTFLVIAGEQVRNLPQLRVGDTVTLEFYDTLALELKKGGTGVPSSRTDSLSESRAALGQRPGGITTRETVIVADVIATDAPTQTISLRGPGGRTVILPLRDPEQFKRIAVGDQVEATYVEAVALSITPASTVMAPAATPWRRWMVGARVLDVYPNVSSSVSGIDVDESMDRRAQQHVLLHAELRGRGQHYLGQAGRHLQRHRRRRSQDDAGDVHAAIPFHQPRPVEAVRRRRVQLHVFLRERSRQQRRGLRQS